MATSVETRSIWEEIERSESYLVCCMFEEASLVSCVLKNLHDKICTEAIVEDIELNDMLESAPQREGSLVVREVLEEFLSKWRCVDERYYVLGSAETDMTYMEGCNNRVVLGVDVYLQVVEVYVVTLLTVLLSDMDLAISWVEKAALLEHKRQVTSSLQTSTSPLLADERVTCSASIKELDSYEGSSKALETAKLCNGESNTEEAILKFSGLSIPSLPCFWWFHTINLKFGNTRFVVSNGSVLLAGLVLIAYYFMQRKKDTITRILKGQALFMKKVVVDLWQLAFSYQVNRLAAVEPLHSATRGSRCVSCSSSCLLKAIAIIEFT